MKTKSIDKTKWQLYKTGSQLMSIKEFTQEWKDYGLKVATQNWLFCFTKWYLNARRMKVWYY